MRRKQFGSHSSQNIPTQRYEPPAQRLYPLALYVSARHSNSTHGRARLRSAGERRFRQSRCNQHRQSQLPKPPQFHTSGRRYISNRREWILTMNSIPPSLAFCQPAAHTSAPRCAVVGSSTLLVAFVFLLFGLTTPAAAQTVSFTNASAITIPDSGAGTPYPSTINVSGTAGTISQVVVKLNGYTHTYPDDLDVLLVSPTAQKVIVMSDVGSRNDVTKVYLT